MRRLQMSALVIFTAMTWTPAAMAVESMATPAESIRLPDGFRAELLYSVPNQEQGSWVNMTSDPQGRLIVSDQNGSLYRVTPGRTAMDTRVERLAVPIGSAQGLLYAFDSLYVVVNGKAAEGSGLYRVWDRDGDDQFDEVKLLRKIQGGGEHGPHAVILSPDGKSLYVCGGNHTSIPDPEASRVPPNWQEDQLLARMWDAGGHAVGRLAPGGWICRTDPQGQTFELISVGYRNEYDIAFNPDGELFTYDADMEWDIGSPWYRPTRVCHATSGSEFGWRSGTGKWPPYYPDSLPAAVEIGPGSPTGITFGTGARFPAKYQQALFVADWSYGLIYAVHLSPEKSSYTGEFERFATAAPLPVTDIIINPHDGALYFTIGGRRAQSGLYRVTYVGNDSTAPAKMKADAFAADRQLRHRLEQWHTPGPPEIVEQAWPYLAHDDRFVRYAARVAIEHQPVERWRDRALAEEDPQASIHAIIALARCGGVDRQEQMIAALGRIDASALPESGQLALLRAYGLVFARLGEPSESIRQGVLARFNDAYPANSWRLNRELSQLLIYLKAPGVAGRTLELLAKADTQQEQVHYALVLRVLRQGWTFEQRREYLGWFLNSGAMRGGNSFSKFLTNIRNEAIETLSDQEKAALRAIVDASPPSVEADAPQKIRPFVRKWTVADLLADTQRNQSRRDFDRGREMFAAAACFKCHRFQGQGGIIGPDLTGVGNRFTPQYILESLLEPSKTVSDQYQATVFVTTDGSTVVGKIANLSGNRLQVITNMLEPGKFTAVHADRIEAQHPSNVSMMPEGLLDTLDREEILDLIAYLRSGGDRDHPTFQTRQARSATPPRNPAMQVIEDDPNLPRVLLIGDSISIGYTAPVRQLLQDTANVHRPLTNCGPTIRGLEQLDEWLGTKPWDVIHFNWGLHDLKYMGPNGENLADPAASSSHQQVPPDAYAKNLRTLVKRLKQTGAALIWCHTTPVPTGAKGRLVGDSHSYNQIAGRIMHEEGIAIDDLYSFANSRLSEIQRPANVHFTPEGSQQLARQVAESIQRALATRQ